MINSHIPNFFDPIAKGETPPDHDELRLTSREVSSTVHRPRWRSRRRKTQSPSMKCQ
jgi:hypothetical protein